MDSLFDITASKHVDGVTGRKVHFKFSHIPSCISLPHLPPYKKKEGQNLRWNWKSRQLSKGILKTSTQHPSHKNLPSLHIISIYVCYIKSLLRKFSKKKLLIVKWNGDSNFVLLIDFYKHYFQDICKRKEDKMLNHSMLFKAKRDQVALKLIFVSALLSSEPTRHQMMYSLQEQQLFQLFTDNSSLWNLRNNYQRDTMEQMPHKDCWSLC